MKTNHSTFLQALLLILAAVFAMPSQAQELKEGWYKIKRTISASDIEKNLLNGVNLSDLTKLFENDYLSVKEEFPEEQSFTVLGQTIPNGQRTYGARFKKTGLISNIKDQSDLFFYVTPLGENKYTIRAINGHYLHSDGTFCVEPETLYLDNPYQFSGSINGVEIDPTTISKIISKESYSVGSELKEFNFDPSKISSQLNFSLNVAFKQDSWQQKYIETTDEEGNVTTTQQDYLDSKHVGIMEAGTEIYNALKEVIKEEDQTKLVNNILCFLLRNFCGDSFEFEKIPASDFKNFNNKLFGIGGKDVTPYTVRIQNFASYDGATAKDYNSALSKNKQLTHTNAAVKFNCDAVYETSRGVMLYDNATVFVINNDKKLKLIEEGEHICTGVEFTDYIKEKGINYDTSLTKRNCVADFTNAICSACVDEATKTIYVFVTEPGQEWKIGVAQNKFVTRYAPFALNIAASETEGALMWKKTYTSEAYYAKGVDGENVELVKLDDVIPAHTAVVIKNTSKESDSHEFKYTVAAKDAQATEAPADNLLHGVCFGYTLDSDVNAYVLKTIDGKQKFYKLNQEDRKLTPWRAYLEWDGAASSALRIADFEEDVEGIDTVLAPENANAPIYDLSGRRVNSSNGVTISAGKKYINK